MEYTSLSCQVCLTKFNRVSDFKKHMHSKAHQQKMGEIFQKDEFRNPAFIPSIIVVDPVAKSDRKLIIGLSVLTLCFSAETRTFFYLCHACEEKRPPDKILHHLFSGDHYSNYFNYTDPNVLSFSWMPSMDMRTILRPLLTKEVKAKGSGTLQMLDLPEKLIQKLQTCTYSEVLHTLNENDKFLKLFEAAKPKRTMIQTYQRDSNRKHPLLGMQHLVECISVGLPEKRYYLCTLCHLTLATHMLIKHVLSFDHIFCYFKAWHPSTLLSKECYKHYTESFASMIQDFAKQTEEIHGTANTDLKEVSLEPAEFQSVDFTCYAEALKKVESIVKEDKGSSLITIIKPGNKLEHRPVSAAPQPRSYKLRCQDCSVIFENVFQYLNHLSQWNHKQMLNKFLEEGAGGYNQTVYKPNLGLYRYILEGLKRNQPVIGASLVVTCVSSEIQTEPIYICFACKDTFPDSSLRQHFNSRKHLVNTLLYQNPWRLPFAWEDQVDVKLLKSMAWEEENERGPHQRMLKVLDIPYCIFYSLIHLNYPKVMAKLKEYHTLLKNEVPRCETNTRLKQNERFPLLGKQFMVMHEFRGHESTDVGFLCLLCMRRLPDDDCHVHVFSREHVVRFLDCFHPGSQSSSTDTETLLDLAQQAEHIHKVSHVQRIELDKPIWEPCSYYRVMTIVAAAKRRHGGGSLQTPIIPQMKLFPRETVKKVGEDHVRDNSQKNSTTMEGFENKTSQKSPDSKENILEKVSAELDSEITNKCSVKSEDNAEKEAHQEYPMPSNKESEEIRGMFSETSPAEIKTAGRETYQWKKEKVEEVEEPITRRPSGEIPESCQNTEISPAKIKNAETETYQWKKEKVEEVEEPITRRPSGEIPESCQNTEKDDEAETGNGSKSYKQVLTNLKGYMCKENERKRPNSMSDEDVGREMGCKRQQLFSKEDTSHEDSQKIASSGLKEVTSNDKGESGKLSHKTLNDKVSSTVSNQEVVELWQYVKKKSREPVIGLSALLECHCDQHDPIYLCECCSVKIPEKNIISHITGFDHQQMYLMGSWKLSGAPVEHHRMKVRQEAALLERDKGYGEAQVVDLDEEIYNNISKQSFKSAIQTVKALQAQQDSRCELPSTSALSGVQPVHASVTVHAHHEVDNIQGVVIDDPKDSEAQPSSVPAAMPVMTETTSTKVPHQSNADVTGTHIKVPKSADKANTRLTVSRCSKDASSPHVSKSGTNTAILHFGSTGNNAKGKIPPNKSVEPSKAITSSNIVGMSQTAATSNSATLTKSKTAISKCTAKWIASTTKMATANPNSSITTISSVPTSSCTTTTMKRREPNYKCTATTSTATAATTKLTASSTICTATTSKYTAASSKFTGTAPIYSGGGSCHTTKTTNSAPGSKPLESNAGAASKVTATSYKAAPSSRMGSTVGPEAARRTKPSETTSRIMVTSQATGTVMATDVATSVKCKNTEASDVAPHIHKRSPSAAPYQTTAMSVRSEHKNPPTGQSHTSKTKPRENFPKVGMDHVITVICGEKQKVFCLLCSIKMIDSNHVVRANHKRNYVKRMYPHLTGKLEESKLNKIVAHLAEAEKDVGSQRSQSIAVTSDEYKLLGDLSDMEALERVKKLLKKRNLRAQSSSTTENAGALRQQGAFASPCEVSSSDDGTYMPQNEMSGLSTNNKPNQENKHGLQTPLGCMPEIKSNLREKAGQSDGAQKWTDKHPEAHDLIPDQLQTCVGFKGHPDPIPAPSMLHQAAHTKESVDTFAQTPHKHQEASENRQQQERSDPEIQDTEKTSPVISPSPAFSSAALDVEQQDQLRPSLKAGAGHVPKHPGCRPGPVQDSTSQALPKISVGERIQGCSNISRYLTVRGLDTEPIIGLGNMWECRGKSEMSFFLCESCSEMLSHKDVIQHVVSVDHKLNYILMQYPHLLSCWRKNLTQDKKLENLNSITKLLSQQERFNEIDAQVVMLGKELYECVQTAPFSEALKMVENIKKDEKVSVFCLPTGTPQQRDKQSEKRQSRKESLPMEAPETDQRSDNGARQKPEKHLEEETAVAGDLDGLKHRTVSSPLDVASASSKADSVVFPFPGAGTCLNPQETCRSLFMQPELGPPVSQHQSPVIEMQVRQAEVQVEAQSVCRPSVSPKTTETPPVSPRDKCLSSRKRPADTSVETLYRTSTDNPQLKDPLPAKCTLSSLQQHCQPSPDPACDSTWVCHLPIKPIITARTDLTNQQLMGGCKGQDHTEVFIQGAPSSSTVETANPSTALAASGECGQHSKMVYVTYGNSGHLSSEAIAGYSAPDNLPVNTGVLYQGYNASGLYPNRIHPEKEAIWGSLQSFGHSLPSPVSLAMHQQLHQDQQQQLQQQHVSWTSANLAHGDGTVTSAYLGSITQHNHSQSLIDPNKYSAQIIVPMQNSSNIITQNTAQLYFRPPAFQ